MKPFVTIKVRDYETWPDETRKAVARWLREKAAELEAHDDKDGYAEVVRFRYYA